MKSFIDTYQEYINDNPTPADEVQECGFRYDELNEVFTEIMREINEEV